MYTRINIFSVSLKTATYLSTFGGVLVIIKTEEFPISHFKFFIKLLILIPV